MLVLLGEVGGVEEYRVVEAVKKGVPSHHIIVLIVEIPI
jgi:succinyl-CoA synthetase alpha subunit